jgi:hypothetical protein
VNKETKKIKALILNIFVINPVVKLFRGLKSSAPEEI